MSIIPSTRSWLVPQPTPSLPAIPSAEEKLVYTASNRVLILCAATLSFSGVAWCTARFLAANALLWPLFLYFGLTVGYFAISFLVNCYRRRFSLADHTALVRRWAAKAVHADVDVFLPTCGEPLEVLANTWAGVAAMCAHQCGQTAIYVLDDADRPEVAALASRYGFTYSVRANRGWFKKAGNLRHGYQLSHNEFVVIFDADFRPRPDFLRELLPYFFAYPQVGIVQSPQYFDVADSQHWLERGAGAVQEFFYRYSQQARQSHDASICVGTNAIYRRRALDDTGGTALIEHSEDVHTGFNMRMYGWTLQYVPIVLAKGLCPDTMSAFFKQQYRWCLGSMSLLGSKKFWTTRMRLRQRLCYFTGFCYYIHTALTLLVAPLIPLALLLCYPQEVSMQNYLLIVPSFVYAYALFPLWHKLPYGAETWATKHIYSWAHLVAIVDALRGKPMGWVPTGTVGKKDRRYLVFRLLQVCCSFLPALLWTALAFWRVELLHQLVFLPLLVTGAIAAYTTGKVALYGDWNELLGTLPWLHQRAAGQEA